MDAENFVKLRYDWYQLDSFIVIAFYTKGASNDKLTINFEEKTFNIEVKLQDSKFYKNSFKLFQAIVPDLSSHKIMSTKIEVKLKKAEGYHWTSLETTDKKEVLAKSNERTIISASDEPPSYPSSSTKKHNWNKLEAEIKKDEENEKPEGDAALNNLFQKIYGEGNEEVKKAMNKSFSESGGTCLSTNWKDVSNKKVDVTPPDGMEYKKWE